MKTKIKICGLTKVEEAEMLNQEAIDFAGMVLFFPKSKRNITIEQAECIIKQLTPSIKKTAVVVEPSLEQVQRIEAAGFDFIQIHGKIQKEILEKTEIPILKAFNVKDLEELEKYREESRIKGYVFDAQEPGAGKVFDWKLLQKLPRDGKMILLAGGLSPENVKEAIRQVHPDGVDVSSGVENPDGNGKSAEKVTLFAAQVREADKSEFFHGMDFMRLGQLVNRQQWQAAQMTLRRMDATAKELGLNDYVRNFAGLRAAISARDANHGKDILAQIIQKRARFLNVEKEKRF